MDKWLSVLQIFPADYNTSRNDGNMAANRHLLAKLAHNTNVYAGRWWLAAYLFVLISLVGVARNFIIGAAVFILWARSSEAAKDRKIKGRRNLIRNKNVPV